MLEVLEERPEQLVETEASATKFRKWAAHERAAWLLAISKDPLLPGSLLPSDYLGRKAWQARAKVFRSTHEQMARFSLGESHK